MGQVVTLSADDLEVVRERARAIGADSRAAGWRSKFSSPTGEDQLAIDARSAGAELAAMRATGLPWRPRVKTSGYRRAGKTPDLGGRTEVRNSRRPDGPLLGYREDQPWWDFVLVTGDLPTFEVVGWASGMELLRQANWREPPAVKYAAYVLPQEHLKPLPVPEAVAAGVAQQGPPAEHWVPLADDPEREADLLTGEVRQRAADRSDAPQPAADLSREEWQAQRDRSWSPNDPQRRCWTCGGRPSGAYPDKSPRYRCTHAAELARDQLALRLEAHQ